MKTKIRITLSDHFKSLSILIAFSFYFINLSAQTGPNYAGSVVNDGSSGTAAWINSSSASSAVDNVLWAETPNLAGNQESQYLKATNFGFTIPNFHVIDGIEVKIEGYKTDGNIRDIEVVLVIGGVIQTIENRATGSNLAVGPPDGITTYGGSADLWGQLLTKAIVEASGFGVALRVKKVGGGAPSNYQALIDRLSISVYHSFKVVDDDPTNELNTNLTLTGSDLNITDAGGTLSIDLSSISGSGPVGPTGAMGAAGVAGPQGATGAQGIQGITGINGAQGATGPQGIQGLYGATGSQGPQGSQGIPGTNGSQGPTGSQGIQGLIGATGAQGIQGLNGTTGSQGIQGPTGPQGLQGIAGTNGGTGSIGPAGPAGPTGANAASDEIFDADNDTKIQVEKNADEDVIRFDMAGTEHWVMQGARLEAVNSGNSVFIGENAGANDDLTSNQNVFIGNESGNGNTNGQENTFVGFHSGRFNTTGNGNSFFGNISGYSNSTGYSNTFSGTQAGYSNTTGFLNTFSGHQAGFSNTTGAQNTFSGRRAGYSNTTGNNNTFSGISAGTANTAGYWNTFSGVVSGQSNQTGFGNSYFGKAAGAMNVSGNNNTAIGTEAGFSALGSNNVFIGYLAGYYETGDDKLYIDNNNTTTPLIWGDFANDELKIYGTLGIGNAYTFPTSDGTSGQVLSSDGAGNMGWSSVSSNAIHDSDNDTKIQVEKNPDEDIIRFNIADVEKWVMQGSRLEAVNTGQSVFIGENAGANDDLSNNQNVFVGYQSGTSNTTGASNTFSGFEAGYSNSTGNYNSFYGAKAGYSNTTGIYNTFSGLQAGYANTTGSNNTFTGVLSGNANSTGSNNTFNGFYAGVVNTIGANNVFLGTRAGNANTTGGQNTFTGVRTGNANTTGSNNTFAGYQAGYSNTNANDNTFNGYWAGYSTTTGSKNTFVGRNAGKSNTTGNTNNAFGYGALSENTIGDQNIAIGGNALKENTTAWFNTAVGASVMELNTSGERNTAVGASALHDNTTGSYNSAFGWQSLLKNTTGNSNNALGYSSLQFNTTGTGNVAIGNDALQQNTIGSANAAVGNTALGDNTTGGQNSAVGFGASGFNSTGNRNTSVGYAAAQENTSGSDNVAIGRFADIRNLGSQNVVIGTGAGTGPFGGSHTKNGSVMIGYNAGYNETNSNRLYIENSNSATPLIYGEFDNHLIRINGTFDINNAYSLPTSDGTSNQVMTTDGAGNVSWQAGSGGGSSNEIADADNDTKIQVEKNADEDIIRFDLGGTEHWVMNGARLESMNSGSSVFIGEGAGENDDLSNNQNIFIGFKAGNGNTTGGQNTFIGERSGFSTTTGGHNSFYGLQSGYNNANGWDNAFLGYLTGFSNTSGSYNAFTGQGAGYSNTSGQQNTFSGWQAGFSNTSANWNTALGSQAGLNGTTWSNRTAIGYNAQNTGSNQVHLGNTLVTSISGQVNYSTYSDARIKENIEENVAGLDFIKRLRPVTYNFNAKKEMELLGISDESDYSEKFDIEKITFSGFLAQEVELAANESGYEFSGVKSPKDDNELYGLSYAEFVVPLVKAVQEQQEEIEAQELALEERDGIIQELEKENEEILDRLEKIEELLSGMGTQGSSTSTEDLMVEDGMELFQNIPNPFDQTTQINYRLSTSGNTVVRIYDEASHEIEVLVDTFQEKGEYSVDWDASKYSMGLYVYVLTQNGKELARKMMVLR